MKNTDPLAAVRSFRSLPGHFSFRFFRKRTSEVTPARKLCVGGPVLNPLPDRCRVRKRHTPLQPEGGQAWNQADSGERIEFEWCRARGMLCHDPY